MAFRQRAKCPRRAGAGVGDFAQHRRKKILGMWKEHSNCLFNLPDETAHAFTLAPIRNNSGGTKNMAKAAVKAKKAPAKAAPAKQAPTKAAPAKKPVAKKPAGKKSAA